MGQGLKTQTTFLSFEFIFKFSGFGEAHGIAFPNNRPRALAFGPTRNPGIVLE
jgi:hypothetical protein